jgi:hypothetical protein
MVFIIYISVSFDGRITRDKIIADFRHLINEVYSGKPNDDDDDYPWE